MVTERVTGDMEDLGMTMNLDEILVLGMALEEPKQCLLKGIYVQYQ